MPNKMERFTQRARRVLSLAHEEAERYQHSYIGTEHLLIGLMREEGGVAGHVLRALGVELRQVEELVETRKEAQKLVQGSSLDLSPDAKKLLELSVDEARRLGHHYIGTEHLLLALVRQSEGVAIDVLKRLGVSPEEVRRQTRRVLQESPVQPPPTPSSTQSDPSQRGILRGDFGISFRTSETSERTKILQMIEDGKITVDEGTRLLSALEPPMSVIYPALAPMIAYIFKWSGAEKRRVRLVITDEASGGVKTTVQFDMVQVEQAITAILDAVFQGKAGQVVALDAADRLRLEVFIEDSEPKSE